MDVIADTALGNPDKVVVVGAHLEGPATPRTTSPPRCFASRRSLDQFTRVGGS